MKTIIPGAFVFIVFALCIISFIEMRCLRSDSRELRTDISTLSNLVNENTTVNSKNDSLLNEIAYLKLERQTYSDLIGRESDRFIGYVSILFLIASLSGYVFFIKIIDSRINAFESKNQDTYDAQNKDHEAHKKEFLNLRIDHLLSSANLWAITSEVYRDSLPAAFVSSLKAALQNIKCANLKSNTEFNFEIIEANMIAANDTLKKILIDPVIIKSFVDEHIGSIESTKNDIDSIVLFKNDKIKSIGFEISLNFNELTKKIQAINPSQTTT